ncbi:hypothetical protein AciX8_4063 [Granulicella mallensis MP5ACTX8]|uniref:Uncharacterized protein n=1 Tax=Granulicella mallensis (strain ATCC BAA-1857 / DSM 23137 / MP5ACTX8) TaxID=682795 RepID=G8NQ10_GRAMM|nr:hypothetical protein AciX8_4063 [Granulicella mallensis MP5ACTX8]
MINLNWKTCLITRSSKNCFLVLLVLVFTSGRIQGAQHAKVESRSFNLEVDHSVIVRLFYQPLNADFLHAPLVFQVVDESDPYLNKAPMTDAGRMVYISLPEMRSLVHGLGQFQLAWQEFGQRKPLLPAWKSPASDGLEITVLYVEKASQAHLSNKQTCQMLARLNGALKQPRALWELQRFETNYACKIRGFNPEEYPDHY